LLEPLTLTACCHFPIRKQLTTIPLKQLPIESWNSSCECTIVDPLWAGAHASTPALVEVRLGVDADVELHSGDGRDRTPTCDLWHVRVVILVMPRKVEENHGIPGRNQS